MSDHDPIPPQDDDFPAGFPHDQDDLSGQPGGGTPPPPPPAAPTLGVNSQITDAVTQTNVKVVAESPAQSLGMLYQMSTQAAGLSMQNAVQAQQGLNQISTAAVAVAVKQIMKLAEES